MPAEVISDEDKVPGFRTYSDGKPFDKSMFMAPPKRFEDSQEYIDLLEFFKIPLKPTNELQRRQLSLVVRTVNAIANEDGGGVGRTLEDHLLGNWMLSHFNLIYKNKKGKEEYRNENDQEIYLEVAQYDNEMDANGRKKVSYDHKTHNYLIKEQLLAAALRKRECDKSAIRNSTQLEG